MGRKLCKQLQSSEFYWEVDLHLKLDEAKMLLAYWDWRSNLFWTTVMWIRFWSLNWHLLEEEPQWKTDKSFTRWPNPKRFALFPKKKLTNNIAICSYLTSWMWGNDSCECHGAPLPKGDLVKWCLRDLNDKKINKVLMKDGRQQSFRGKTRVVWFVIHKITSDCLTVLAYRKIILWDKLGVRWHISTRYPIPLYWWEG